jgi:hypothetical protein
MALTCDQIAKVKKALQDNNKNVKRLVERGMANDPQQRKVIIELKEASNKLRDLLRAEARPLSKTMRFMNLGRGIVTSRMYTAMNNLRGNAVRAALESAKMPVRVLTEAITGDKQGATLAGAFERIADIGRANKGSKRAVNELLKLNDQYDRGFMTWASDITKLPEAKDKTLVDKAFTRAERGVQLLGIVNRLNDELFFRPAFLSRLREIAKREGLDLTEILSKDRLGDIKTEWVREATDDAMAMTYKLETKKALPNAAGKMLDAMNTSPMGTMFAPFPRFMANSYRFMLDHSPWGLISGWAKRDSRKMASGMVGTGLLFTAWQVKQRYGGENWYELRVPGTDRVLDVRRWSPEWAPYMILADVLERAEAGRGTPNAFKDAAEVLTGANLRGGPGAALVGYIEDMIRSGEAGEATKEFSEKVVADFAGRYVAPLSQFKDFVQIIKPEARKMRDVAGKPLDRLRAANLPSRDLPETESATRAATPEVSPEAAALRFAGQRLVEPKNRVEAELDRIGVARTGPGSVAYYSGVPKWDRMVRRHMGELADAYAEQFLDGEYAQIEDREKASGLIGRELRRKINFEKRKALRDFFKMVRAEAVEAARAEEGGEDLYTKAKAKRLGAEELERRNLERPEEERIDPNAE